MSIEQTREVAQRAFSEVATTRAGKGATQTISFSVEVVADSCASIHTVYLASVTSDLFAAPGTRVLEGRAIDEGMSGGIDR